MESIGADLVNLKRIALSDAHVAAIREIATERTYTEREMVARTGEPHDRFIYVVKGEIALMDPADDEKVLGASLGPTQFFGDIGFLHGGVNYLSSRALKDTLTLEVPREEMLDLMARMPELSDHVITVFAARRRRQFEMGEFYQIGRVERDPAIQRVEAFLSRNRIPFQYLDLNAPDKDATSPGAVAHHEPAVIVGNDQRLEDPSPRKVAQMLGLDAVFEPDVVADLLIVGGGPAGVAAAVYAGAEGLHALLVEDLAIGGQAGTSSRIENYMGFPTGISGTDLVFRGQIQALKFGTRFAMPRRAETLARREDGVFCIGLNDGTDVCARAVLIATGVQYRRMPIDRLKEFEGAGIFYAATEMEARFCRETEVIVVGGGNSAGQAAMYLSRSAKQVRMLVRSDSLAASMSDYLLRRLEATPNIDIIYGAELAELEGGDHLEAVTCRQEGVAHRYEAKAVFVMIGAAPNTEWLSGLVNLDGKGFVLTGEAAGVKSQFQTSCPGIFAVGDVRASSVKRVASAVGEGSVAISAIYNHVHSDQAHGV